STELVTDGSDDHVRAGQRVRLAPATDLYQARTGGDCGHFVHQRWQVDGQAWVEIIEFLPRGLPNLFVLAAQFHQELPARLGIEFEWLQFRLQERHGGIRILIELEYGTRRGRVVAIEVGPQGLEFLLRCRALFRPI